MSKKMQGKKKNAKSIHNKSQKHARAPLKQKTLHKKNIEKKTNNEKKPQNSKTLVIAQEVKFARLLASNDKRIRDKVLKNLKKWLSVRSESSFAFTEADFMRLWKGLFFCMWMSDKPLVQEDLAQSLSNLVHCFSSLDTALLYTKCTLKTLTSEWFGIDRYRLDKFQMLVRRIIRQTFEMCKKHSWEEQWVVGVGKVIEEVVLDPKACLGLNLHITDVYMEELAKIADEKIPKSMVTEFVRPFVIYLAGSNDDRQVKHIVKNIFRYLILQSDVGIDYSEKFNAWREAGFPCTSIDEMQKVELSDEENENDDESEIEESTPETREKPLDPRAGRVDVEIPQIPFDAAAIADVLKQNKFHKLSTTMTRKHITKLINDFNKLNEGDMPFGIKELPIADTARVDHFEKAEELVNFQRELHSDSRKKKRKTKEDVEELIANGHHVEELDEDCDRLLKTNSKSKKQKLSDSELENSEKENSEQTEKAVKKKVKTKLSAKMKSKRLNVSDPLPKKSAKKSAKKLNNTVVESVESTKIEMNEKNINQSGTSSNWNIEVPKSLTTTPVKTKKKISKKESSLTEKKVDITPSKAANVPWLTPVLTRLEEQKTPSPKKSSLKQTPRTDSAKKRVQIVLQRNTAQNTSEYFRQIIKNPEIPFDANRKPKAGVLKASPLPSPINPFYKRKNFQ